MAQTVSNLTKVLKEVWTADQLEKQYYDQTPWLDKIEKTDKYTIGKEAEVPLHTGRAGATTILGSAGGALNAADAQRVNRGSYNLSYNYNPIKLELGAINQATGGNTSVVDALNLEVEGAVADLRKDITRQIFGNGDALIAQCTTTSGSLTVSLLSTGYGNEALVRGFLRAGQTIDISTSASTDANITNGSARVIQSVTTSSSAPTIVLDTAGGVVTTTSSHYVKITGARTGNTAAKINEMIGLRTIYGSATSVIGGLDPATETYWQPAQVDNTTTVMSLDLPLSLQQNVFQQTGEFPTFALTGVKQLTNLYTILQNQVRFAGDVVRTGNVMSVQWNGLDLNAQPDASDREFYLFDPSSWLLCTGKYSKPTWVSDVMGVNHGLVWSIGNTNFNDSLVYALTPALRRRNNGAAAITLTA